MTEHNYKKNIRRVFAFWLLLFAALFAFIVNFVMTEAPGVIANTYNRRINLVQERVARGMITDANGRVLAMTDSGTRVYPFRGAFAHVIGFTGIYGFGVERHYSVPLLTVHGELMARLNAVSAGDDVMGNSVLTTLDANLNLLAQELLEGKHGSVVALEPKTGKILAMASFPSFDPNRVATDYDDFVNSASHVLLNRASQGLYPPGSVYKIVTLTAAMRHMRDFETFTYECRGSITTGGKQIRCFNETAHGELDIYTAFAKSCNGFFVCLADEVGAEALTATAEELLFNTALPYPMEYAKSSHPLDNNAASAELAETSIGQGRLMATPLHFALITSAIANGGVLCEPYAVACVFDETGSIVSRHEPQRNIRLFSAEEAEILTKAMYLTVTEGTAALMGMEHGIAAKTGSAQNPHGDDHGWVAAFAPFDDPRIALVIMIENNGGSREALEPAFRIIDAYLGD